MDRKTQAARWYINNFPHGASKEVQQAHWDEYTRRFNA